MDADASAPSAVQVCPTHRGGDEYFDLRICRGIFPSGPAGLGFPMKVAAEIGNYKNIT